MNRAGIVGGCAIAAALACHAPTPERPPTGPDVRKPDDAPVITAADDKPPGPRLPDTLVPLGYDLALDVDPDSAGFTGHVEIRVRATAPTTVAWLHAVDLEISGAALRDAPSSTLPLTSLGEGEQMRGFRLPHQLAANAETTLVFDYRGGTSHEEQGLFREQARGAWYLYAQAESVFARRILPCFDEPRWKPTWLVHLTIPRGMSGFSNAPEAARQIVPNGKLSLTFAPTPPMPSYLLSVAVGPFDVVDAGALGRAHVPVRVIVPAGDGAHTPIVAQRLPAIVDALEAYFDEPLPVAKLDLVGVPRFFGGMENPGLITFALHVLTGESDDLSDRRTFQRFAGHELAHLWLGDLVTPAWWDELWLAEAFASWLGDKVVASLDGFDDGVLRAAQARDLAFAADALPDPRPLRRPVEHGDDAEAAFDAIAYEKGAAVLAMLEHWIGEDPLRVALRGYVRAHANGTATSADFIHAFVSTPYAMQSVLTAYTDHPGTPVVELALRCDVHPVRVDASLRVPGASVPVCLRYPGTGGPAGTCRVVGASTDSATAHAELVLTEAGGCPAWVIGNADGAGYYATQWVRTGVGPVAPLDAQTPAERLVYGNDLASAVERGDLAPTAALAELTRLAASSDPYAVLAALAIARSIAPLVDDPSLPRWWDYLTAQLAERMTPDAALAPTTPAWRAVRDQLLALVPGERFPAATVRRARAELDRALTGAKPSAQAAPLEVLAAIGGPGGGSAGRDRFAKLLALAARTDDADLRDDIYDAAGAFGLDELGAAIAAVTAREGELAWPVLHGYLERRVTAAAAWTAMRPQLATIVGDLTPDQASELVASAETLCDAPVIALASDALAPLLPAIPDGKKTLDRALAIAVRCVARRAREPALASALKR